MPGQQGRRPRPTKKASAPHHRGLGFPSPNFLGKATVPAAPAHLSRYEVVPEAINYAAPKNSVREMERRRRTSYRLAGDWKQISKAIKERDAYTCQSCGVWGPDVTLDVDHIVEWADGGSNHPSNLQTLCRPCHAVKSQITAKAAGRPHRGSH